MSEHISKKLDAHLDAIRRRVLQMSAKVMAQLSNALKQLETCHLELDIQVDAAEEMVNDLHIAIDEECTHIIATQQPAAGDLRYVLATSRIAGELEQVGNRAVEIARCGARIYKGGRKTISALPVILKQSAIAAELLAKAIDSYAKHDANILIAALQTNTRLRIASLFIQNDIASELPLDLPTMMISLETTEIAKTLVRLGEHALQIAIHVAYLENGVDFRHANIVEMEKEFG